MSKYPYVESLQCAYTLGYDYYESENDSVPALTVTMDAYEDDYVVDIWPDSNGLTGEYEGVTLGNPHGACPNIETPVFWNGERIGDAHGLTQSDWLLSIAEMLLKVA